MPASPVFHAPSTLSVCGAGLMAALVCVWPPSLRAEVAQGVRAVLTSRGSFAPAHWEALQGGKPLAFIHDGADDSEVSAVGAIRLRVPSRDFVSRFRTIEQLESGPQILQIGRLGRTPTIADFRRLTLDREDYALLRSCKPGDCRVQLPDDVMARARQAALVAPDQADAVIRQYLLDLVMAYRKRGAAALTAYHDKSEPLSMAAAFDALLLRRPPLVAGSDLGTFYRQYPNARVAGMEEFFYWTKIDFSLRPTIRLNHVAILPLGPRVDGLRYLIASRQLWASHYFDSALELRLVADDLSTPHGSYLIYDTTVRSRSMSGTLAGLVRGRVRRQAKDALEAYLVRVQQTLETRIRTAAEY